MTDRQQAPAKASNRSGGPRSTTWPGIVPGSTMAVLSGFACWFWLIPLLAAGQPARPGTVGEVAEVADADLSGALSTVDLPGTVMARLRAGSRECGARLAWVTLSRPSGAAPQAMRLRSGSYFSPAFSVGDTPVRVAIPFPAPYESGHGTLTVLGAGSDVVVALRPAWHVPASPSAATHEVTWHPAPGCVRP